MPLELTQDTVYPDQEVFYGVLQSAYCHLPALDLPTLLSGRDFCSSLSKVISLPLAPTIQNHFPNKVNSSPELLTSLMSKVLMVLYKWMGGGVFLSPEHKSLLLKENLFSFLTSLHSYVQTAPFFCSLLFSIQNQWICAT